MKRRSVYRYAWIAVALGALAGLEFAFEYLSSSPTEASLCLAPQSRSEAIKEALLHHLRGH